MNKKLLHKAFALLILFLFFLSNKSFSQNIAINSTGAASVASAMLDITSTTSGLLIPRMTAAQRVAIAAPATSLLVYQTDAGTMGIGYYFYNGTAWVPFGTNNGGWGLLGNTGTVSGTNYLGTTDAQALDFRTSGILRFRVANANQVHAMALGTAALPFYSWSADPNTGIFSPAADQIGLSTTGTERFRIPAANQVHAMSDGTAALPFYSWSADPNMGIYRIGVDILGVSTAGAERMRVIANGRVAINSTLTAAQLDVRGTMATAIGSYAEILGYNTNGTGTGFMGTGQNSILNALVAGSGGAFTGVTTAIYGYYTTPGIGEAGVMQDAFGAQWLIGEWTGAAYRKISGTGSVATIVKDLNDDYVIMNCTETPENIFQDMGTAKLINGKAHIVIDPILTKNIIVNEKHPLKVFIQLEGDCKGVYVTNKTAAGFDVVELDGGTSSVEFSYTLFALRGEETVSNPQTGLSRVARYDQRWEKAPEYKANLIKK